MDPQAAYQKQQHEAEANRDVETYAILRRLRGYLRLGCLVACPVIFVLSLVTGDVSDFFEAIPNSILFALFLYFVGWLIIYFPVKKMVQAGVWAKHKTNNFIDENKD